MDICAELTLRVARFIHMPADPPASPVNWFFMPEFLHARWDRAGELLAAAPKPLIVAPLPDPGALGTWFAGALTGEHRARADHQISNQQSLFAKLLDDIGLTDESSIVFDSGVDETVLGVPDFKRWLREYAVCAGSNLGASPDDPSRGRLFVRRPNGEWSPGRTCRIPPT